MMGLSRSIPLELCVRGCITPAGDARKLAGQLRAELAAVPALSAAPDRGLALDLEPHAAWPWSGSRPARSRIIINHNQTHGVAS